MLDQVKEFLGIDVLDDSKDVKLNVYISMAVASIKNYLNNPNFDDEYIKENFSAAIIMIVNNAYKSDSMGTGTGNVKMMKQGERTVEYFDTTSSFSIENNGDIKALLPAPYVNLYY